MINREWSASVPLQEGNNTLTAVAFKNDGSVGTDSIQVTLDTTPPHVTVESPPDGFRTTEEFVTVTGIVNDIVVGTVNSGQARVTVNGNEAQVANRTYNVAGIALQSGANTLQVIGTDQVGNSVTVTSHVTRETVTQPYIKTVSGNNQSGPVGAELGAPFEVQLLDNGNPVAGVPVIFKVTENDGFLKIINGRKLQLVAVNTNAEGKAQAILTLGNRAGAGNNIVEAYATGYQGTALFIASGTPSGPAHINVDAGTNQFGATGSALPLPFVAVVTDEGHNRLGGVPVTFTVTQGGGHINGKTSIETVSDSDGRVVAVLTLGPDPGQDNNVVEATFAGNTGFPAAFAASGKTPGDPAQTTISGVVQDNSNNPIPGVTMRLFTTHQLTNTNSVNNNQPVEVVTPVMTDDTGAFKITQAPVGNFKLMADGATATVLDQQFPTLEYDMVTVAGQDNGVGTPIYLPALDPDAKVCVDETTGGVLKMATSPGFSLTIVPGATFPGGSKTGCVSVTPVNPDKVPMVPGFGQQPRYVVTIQPVGTTFNPPAAITIPNLDGLAPHAKTEMYSYDHDLASFVAIGSATVSADGAVIASDPGIGVIKAGWHCGGDPNVIGSAGHCPTCNKCQGSGCGTYDADPRISLINVVKGNCKKLVCLNGAPVKEDDDTDVPEDEICKECMNGELIDKSESEVSFNAASVSLSRIEPGDDPILNPSGNQTINDASTYGLTWPESVEVDIDVRCEGGKFKAEMISLKGNYSLQARYLPHQYQEDVTGIGGNTNEGNYCNQALSLSVLGKVLLPNGEWEYLPYHWYILEAVKRHEEEHLNHYLPALEAIAPAIEAIIEQLSVQATSGKTKKQAIEEIKGSAEYKHALEDARDEWFFRYIVPVSEHDHDTNGLTEQAEHRVVDPVKNSICNYANINGWVACGACFP